MSFFLFRFIVKKKLIHFSIYFDLECYCFFVVKMFPTSLRNPRIPLAFYLITMAVMIIYCVYISKQGAQGFASFNLRFNEPLEAEFTNNVMANKIKVQELELEKSLQRLGDMDTIKSANIDVRTLFFM